MRKGKQTLSPSHKVTSDAAGNYDESVTVPVEVLRGRSLTSQMGDGFQPLASKMSLESGPRTSSLTGTSPSKQPLRSAGIRKSQDLSLAGKVKDVFGDATQIMSELMIHRKSSIMHSKLAIKPVDSDIQDATHASTQTLTALPQTDPSYSVVGLDIDDLLADPREFMPGLGKTFNARHIIKYINDPLNLVRLCALNKAWMKACSTDVAQWADICMRCHSSVGPDIVEDAEERLHSKLEARTAIQSCVWKEVWVSSTVLMQNRGKGACSINHIPVADTGDGVTCFRFNSDQILIGTRLHNLRLLPTLKSNSQGLDRQINFKPKHDSAIICASFISSISSIAASGDSAGRLRVWNTFTGKMIAELPNAHTNGVSSLFLTDKSRFFPNEAKVEEGDNSGIVIVTTGFDCLIQAYLLQFGGRALVGPIRRMQKRKSTINLTGKSVLIPVTDSTKGKDKQACKASYTPAPFASKTVGERLSSIIRPIQRTPGGQLLRPHEACSTSSPRTSSTNFKGMMDGLHFPKRKSETKEPAPPAPVISSLATWKGHSGHVYCVTMLTCGTKLASGGLDHSVRIWSIKHTDCILTLKGHYDTVTCVHAIKHFLFSGSLDKTIRKWDTRTGQTENVIGPSSAWVRCLDSNDKWLVSGGGDETIKVWDIESGTMIHHFILNRGPIVALQVDDRKIVTACRGRGYENQITVLDFSDRDAPFLSYCKRRKSSTKVVDVVRGSQETIANDVGKLETCEITDYQPCIEGFSSESGSSDMDGEEIEVWEDAPSVDDQ